MSRATKTLSLSIAGTPFVSDLAQGSTSAFGFQVPGIPDQIEIMWNLERIALCDVQIAHSKYQRQLNETHRKSIEKKWNLHLALPPVLARRPDDSLWVLDGLHRIENMARNGVTHVSALVIDIETAAYEAWLFSAFNTSGKHLRVASADGYGQSQVDAASDAVARVASRR